MRSRSVDRRKGRASRRGLVAVLAALVLIAAGCEFVAIPGVPTTCTLTPANSVWRSRVTGLPVHSRSANYMGTIGTGADLKADFGSGLWDGGPIGIPYVVVSGSQPKVPVSFYYPTQSDPGGYPVPANPPIEGGPNGDGDRHILMVDKDNCKLYETYDMYPVEGSNAWEGGSGVIWDMRSNNQRPAGWTSADAAGLPILPGLVRYEEVAAGKVLHAIRITVPVTQTTYVWPASHQAGSTASLNAPPMGTWLRLKSTIDPNDFGPQTRPIVVALQTYGAIVADNGSALYMSGAPDERWDNDALRELLDIQGSDFEVVNTTSLKVANGSYESTTAS